MIDFVALLFLAVFVPVTDGKEGTWMNPFFLAFFATGLSLVALRALVCGFLQGYARYAVTDRRVFVNDFFGLVEVSLDKVKSVSMFEHDGNVRSVLVGDVPLGVLRRSRHVTLWSLWSAPECASLERVDDLEGAYLALRTALAALRSQ